MKRIFLYGRGPYRPLGWLVLLALLTCPGLGQPLLIVGEGSAEVKAAFSYEFLSSPLRKFFDRSEGKVIINVPFNVSRPLHSTIESLTGDYLVVPRFSARGQQHFNTSIDVSSPMFGGAGFFAVRENAGLSVNGAIGNANLRIDTTQEGAAGKIRILLKGGLTVPLTFNMYWRSMTFGYVNRPTKYIRIGFQIHRHLFSASTAGNLRTSLTGRIAQLEGDNIFSMPLNYPEERLYADVEGLYEGSAWSPEIALQIGPVGLVSRMGVEIKAKGSLTSRYSIPFFIDDDNFTPRYTEPDSFLSQENIPRLTNSEVTTNNYVIRDNLTIRVPQSHTLSFDFVKDRLFLSYTKTFGKLETFTSNSGAEGDSGYFDTGDYLDASLSVDHVLLFSTRLGWFRHNAGLGEFDVNYRHYRNLYTDLISNFFNYPLMPIWNFGFQLGMKGMVSLDFYVVPLPAVRTGFHYAF